jgi:uracil-DNA glycosylase
VDSDSLGHNLNAVNENTRNHLENFLRYAEDLRLGPYFRDRAGSTSAAPRTPIPAGPERAANAASGPGQRGSSPGRQAPSALPLTATAQERRPSIIQVSAGASLFEERIENDSLERIREDLGDCTRCKLHRGRTNIVFGVGNPRAELVFIGEGPGHDEDVQGEPFVGRAGKLLTQMIEAMGLRRQDVYICNVVKCRPPENRLPERDEIAICSPFLVRQIAVIQPKVLCCLGACAAQTLLETNQGISRFRGEWFDYRGAKLIATYHPAYLLRNPNAKGEVWKDLQKVMSVLGLRPKQRR